MGFFDELYGLTFDFYENGKTSFGGEWLGHYIINHCMNRVNEEKSTWHNDSEDGYYYGVFSEDYEDEAEYSEALEEAKYDWRNWCDDGSEFGIVPENYETEKEYNDALKEARYGWQDRIGYNYEYWLDPQNSCYMEYEQPI